MEESSTPLLAIMGRVFPFDDSGVINIAGSNVVIKERHNNASEVEDGGTGLNVWDGSLLLAKYLECRPELVRNKAVIELGAGCGLVGVLCGILGAKEVIMTDLKYALPLMQENIKRNESLYAQNCKTIDCKECDWFCPPPVTELFCNNNSPDVLLVADCIWLVPLIGPLLRTLEVYAADYCTTVIITYQQRGNDSHREFWNGIHRIFDVVDVDTESFELSKPDVFHVLECTLKHRRDKN